MSGRNEKKSGEIENVMEERPVSNSRRKFNAAGLLASPVLLSVVSRPVFGVGCMSNILSGNLSEPDRGDCNLGLTPRNFTINPGAWPISAGFVRPGNKHPDSCNDCRPGNGNSNAWICTGGTVFSDYFPGGSDRQMYELLCMEPGSNESYIITALLNALTDPSYVLTVAQVQALWADPTMGGQISDFKAFLNSTWA